MRIFPALAAALLVSGCATKYQPTTEEGARCKQRCSETAQLCRNHPMYCDSKYSTCVESCADAERLAGK